MSARIYPESDIKKAEAIRRRICKVAGITLEEMNMSSNSPKYSHPRQLAMFIIRQLTGMPMNHIGPLFNRHGDGTVKKACDVVRDYKQYPKVELLINKVRYHEDKIRKKRRKNGKKANADN
tara:strand:- start:6503 stop:6865 length:363 start_codon:yes stop_codon:yes gene_type:complete